MAAYLQTAVTYGPTLYYALGYLKVFYVPAKLTQALKNSRTTTQLFPELHDKVKDLSTSIFVRLDPAIQTALSLGTNFGPAVLFANPELNTIDSDAVRGILKHEIGHIKNNDPFVAVTLGCVVAAISTLVIPFFIALLPTFLAPAAYLIPILAAGNVHNGITAFHELRADSFAFEHATDSELLGMQRLLEAELEVNRSLHEKNPNVFDKEGDYTLISANVIHGPITYRVERVTKALKERNLAPVKDAAREALMERLRAFIRSKLEQSGVKV